MTLFEYLAIAFSLVYSFSAMRFVAGLPYATQPGRRYWVHLTFVCLLLIGTAMAFWAFWGFRDAEELVATGAKALVKTPQEVMNLFNAKK